MNVFSLRNRLIDDYADFMRSYARIGGIRIQDCARKKFDSRTLFFCENCAFWDR